MIHFDLYLLSSCVSFCIFRFGFGGGGGGGFGRQQQERKGPEIKMDMHVTLEEIFNGHFIEVKVISSSHLPKKEYTTKTWEHARLT